MILVYFNGRGEWFRRDDKKLAVVRTTKSPYEDPLEWKRPKDYCPDYDEYLKDFSLGDEDDDSEIFSGWVKLNEEVRWNKEHLSPDDYQFNSREGQYDTELGGVFFRDSRIKGNIYDTDGLICRFGTKHLRCDEIKGYFKLTQENEEEFLEDFRLAYVTPESDPEKFKQIWDEYAPNIKNLLPCEHSKSAFSKMVKNGSLANEDFSKVYFEVQTEMSYGFKAPVKYDKQNYSIKFIDIVDTEIISNKSVTNSQKTAKRRKYFPIAEIVRAAVKQLLMMKNSNDSSGLRPREVALFVLGDDFTHEDIASKTKCQAIRNRRIIIKSDGKDIGLDEISASFSNTVSKEL